MSSCVFVKNYFVQDDVELRASNEDLCQNEKKTIEFFIMVTDDHCHLSSSLLRELLWYSGSTLDCWSIGRAINPALGA